MDEDFDLELKPEDNLQQPTPTVDPDFDLELTPDDNLLDRATALTAQVAGSTDPNALAKAHQLSQRTGMPIGVVEGDPKGWEAVAKQREAAAVVEQNPVLQKFTLGHPLAIGMASQELPNLDRLTKAIEGLGHAAGSPVRGAVRAQHTMQMGRLGSQLATSKALGVDLPEHRAAIEQLEKLTSTGETGVSWLGGLLGEMVGEFGSSIAKGSPEAMVTGAALGAAAAGPAGAAAGVTAGVTGGMFADYWDTRRGLAYLRLDKERDAFGNPLPELHKQSAAVLSATVDTALNAVGMRFAQKPVSVVTDYSAKVVTEMFPSITEKLIGKVVARPELTRPLNNALLEIGKTGLTFGALNAFTYATTKVIEEGVLGLSPQDFKTIFNDPVKFERFGEELTESIVAGLALGGTLAVPTAGRSFFADRARGRQAAYEVGLRDEAMKLAEASFTKQNAPELFQELVQFMNKSVEIPAGIVAANRDAFAYLPDLDAQLMRASAHGGDVVIPADLYFTRMDPEAHGLVSEHIRNSGGLTFAEAKGLDEVWEVWHGSARDFDKFSGKFALTGEGAQVYGAGDAYVGEARRVAEGYKESVSRIVRKRDGGEVKPTLYRVEVKAPEFDFLDWDKPLTEQTPEVTERLRQKGVEIREPKIEVRDEIASLQQVLDDQAFVADPMEPSELKALGEALNESTKELRYVAYVNGESTHVTFRTKEEAEAYGRKHFLFTSARGTGESLYADLAASHQDRLIQEWAAANPGKDPTSKELDQMEAAAQRAASAELAAVGIRGIRYLDAFSRRDTDQPTRNLVVFNAEDLVITHKNDLPVAERPNLKLSPGASMEEIEARFNELLGEAFKAAKPKEESPFRILVGDEFIHPKLAEFAERLGRVMGLETPIELHSIEKAQAEGRFGQKRTVEGWLNRPKGELTAGRRLAIYVDTKLEALHQIDVLVHEMGHAFDFGIIERDPQVKAAVADAHTAWREKALKTKINALNKDAKSMFWGHLGVFVKQGFGDFTLEQMIDYGLDQKTSEYLDYFLSREEWVAREAAKWAVSGKAPRTLLERTFATISNMWQKLVEVLGYERSPSVVQAFLNERAQERLLDALSPVEFKGVEPTMWGKVNYLTKQIEGVTNEMRRDLWLEPILTPDAAGMSKADFARYSKRIQAVQRSITQAAYDAAERELRRRDSDAFKQARGTLRAEIENDLRSRPDIWADNFVRSGEASDGQVVAKEGRHKLNRAAVEALFAEGELPATLDYLMPKDSMVAEGGFDPDELADLSGHSSGKQLIQDLIKLNQDRWDRGETPKRQLQRMVRTALEERLNYEFRFDEDIMRKAMEEAVSVAQLDVLIEEINHLGETKITRQDVERDIRRVFADMPLKQALDVEGFRRMVARYGLEAERALNKGDKRPLGKIGAKDDKQDAVRAGSVQAFLAKQFQLRNALLARYAAKLQKEMAALNRVMDRWGEQKSAEGLDQSYVDQLHMLMLESGFDVPRSGENLREAIGPGKATSIKSLTEFIADKGAVGLDILDLPFDPKPLSEMTAHEARAFKDTVDSLLHAGKQSRLVGKWFEQKELNEVKSEILAQLDKLPDHWEPERDPTFKEATKKVFRNIDASLLKMENFFQWIDGNDLIGTMTRAVFRPIKDAQHIKDEMIAELGRALIKARGDGAWQRSLREKLPEDPSLTNTYGTPIRIDREKLVSIMLNMGNESNYRVLTEGYGWDPVVLERFVRRHARKEDWEFVQRIWDITESLWPKVQEASKRLTGVAVERVVPRPIDTPAGRLKGGYYPLLRAFDEEQMKIEGKDLFSRQIENPFVAHASAMRERTGAKYPLDLSLDRLPSSLTDLAHDIAYREPVANAAKILMDPDIRRSIEFKFGPEYANMLIPWLRAVASDGGRRDYKPMRWWENQSAKFRGHAVVMLVGLKASTSFIHGLAALGYSANEIGPLRFLNAAVKFGVSAESFLREVDLMHRSPEQHQTIWNWAYEQSGELRNRGHNLERELNLQVQRSIDRWKSPNRTFAHFATYFIGALDQASAVPTWVAAYKYHRIEKGLDHDEAVYASDVLVRNAHGSAGLADLAPVQRVNELAKWMTMFYTVFNHNYNRLRTTGRELVKLPEMWDERDWKGIRTTVGQAGMRVLLYLMWPAMVHYAIRDSIDDFLEDPLWTLLKATGLQLAGGVPLVRDTAHYLHSGHAGGSPLYDVLEGTLGKPFMAGKKWLVDDEPSETWLRDLLEAPGWAFGFGTKTTAGWAQFAWDEMMDTPRDYETNVWRLIVDGNPRPKKGH